MNTAHRKKEVLTPVIYVLYLVFLASLVLSFRAVSSITIVAIFLAEIILNRYALLSLCQKDIQNLFLAGCFLLFLLQVIALVYTHDTQEGWSNIRIKTGLLITPLAIRISSYINVVTRKKLLSQYCLVLAVTTFYCLYVSFKFYLELHDSSHFFYHTLVKPLNQHAVYFSLLLMVGLVFLLENIIQGDRPFPRPFHIALVVYLSIFLILLSSKLVIVFYLLYLFSWFIRVLQNKKMKKLVTSALLIFGILIVSLVFATRNPISSRFYEIAEGSIKIVTQDSFKKSDYFNGLQFRLLQWKFVSEILTEKKRWLIGVSPGDAQSILNEKYLSKNMYSGEPSTGSRGYLVYNTHNQFLQTVLQNGVIGLLFLLTICFSLLRMVVQDKNWYTGSIILLLLVWLFTEAPFETQYGIMIFTFFPLFINTGKIKSTKFAE
ncbi:MAG: O-antigen ligase family protein [Chitinophagaceae bacterium]